MNIDRHQHTATLLSNGQVLVAGGTAFAIIYTTLSGAELYDPTMGTWTTTNSLNAAREFHVAALLPGGKVLVAGGANGPCYASSEVYGPVIAPPLSVSLSENTVTVWWLVSGWTLQQNTNLSNPSGWSASSGVFTYNGTNYLYATYLAGSCFYRLTNQ